MNLPRELQLAMHHKDADEIFVNICASLMSNYNMSYAECLKLPIPMAIALIKKLKETEKELERQNKR